MLLDRQGIQKWQEETNVKSVQSDGDGDCDCATARPTIDARTMTEERIVAGVILLR